MPNPTYEWTVPTSHGDVTVVAETEQQAQQAAALQSVLQANTAAISAAGRAPAASNGSLSVGARPETGTLDAGARATPGIAQERYGQVRPSARNSTEMMGFQTMPAIGSGQAPTQTRGFTDQMVSNLGMGDEARGAASYLRQGTGNLVRQLRGQDIEVPAAMAYHAGAEADRTEQANFAREHPFANAQANTAGFLTAGAPNAMQAVAPAATSLGRVLQTGGNAALSSVPYTLANEEGTLQDRLPGAARNSLMAGALGGTLQATSEGLGAMARSSAARPLSSQRQLTLQGVDLSPGRIAGGGARRLEDALRSQPVLGDAINSVQDNSIRSLNRAGHNQTLGVIGEALPRDVPLGYDAMEHTQGATSAFYNRHLDPITVAPDQQLATDLQTAIANIPNDGMRAQAVDIVQSHLRTNNPNPMTGRDWKAIDAQLGRAAASARSGSATNPLMGQLADGLEGAQTAWNGMLARQHPDVARAIDQADLAHAMMLRLENATQASGAAAQEGVFTAPQLSAAVRAGDNSAGNRQFSQGDALLQGLSRPAMAVLPPTLANSGTTDRALRSATVGNLINGVIQIVPAALYSVASPIINQAFRAYARGNPGATGAALSQLTALAARHPDLMPAVRQLTQAVGSNPAAGQLADSVGRYVRQPQAPAQPTAPTGP